MISLRDTLSFYQTCWVRQAMPGYEHQREVVERFSHLLDDGPACLHRAHTPGHITGSLMVTTPDFSSVLLTLHRKLGMWLQLGGHADGEANLHEVALREGEEESGLKDLALFPVAEMLGRTFPLPVPYDLDVHLIPARGEEPSHYHYDARYLAITRRPLDIQISEESVDLRWFGLDDAFRATREPAMHRQFEKLEWLRNSGITQFAPERPCQKVPGTF